MNYNKTEKRIFYIRFVIMFGIGLVMLYPLIWMFVSSFKPEEEIFRHIGLIPKKATFENYLIGWQGDGRTTFSTYFMNSFIMSGLCVLGNVITCSLTAFAFARLKFRFQAFLFAIVILTALLPQHAILVPQYVYFQRMGFIDTFVPIVLPKFLGLDAFFIFLLVQFIRGIPRDLDEAATIDGCSKYGIYARVIMPLSVPALITTTIFSFYWSWNDFFTQTIYLSSSTNYTVAIGLRLFVDAWSRTKFGAMFAMSILSLLPVLVIFVLFQRLLVEGISTTGLKG